MKHDLEAHIEAGVLDQTAVADERGGWHCRVCGVAMPVPDDIFDTPVERGAATLICNGCGHTVLVFIGAGLTLNESGEAILAEAARDGWCRVGSSGLDYCPDCAPGKAAAN